MHYADLFVGDVIDQDYPEPQIMSFNFQSLFRAYLKGLVSLLLATQSFLPLKKAAESIVQFRSDDRTVKSEQ